MTNDFRKLVIDSAFARAARATYRIDTMVGPDARNLPSIAAAKERYIESVREGLGKGDAMPEIQFRVSREHPDLDIPCEEHVECVENGFVDACIWLEQPEWPEVILDRRVPVARNLAMVCDAPVGHQGCEHRRLLCMPVPVESEESDDAHQPGICCADCHQTWSPAPIVGAELDVASPAGPVRRC